MLYLCEICIKRGQPPLRSIGSQERNEISNQWDLHYIAFASASPEISHASLRGKLNIYYKIEERQAFR